MSQKKCDMRKKNYGLNQYGKQVIFLI